jgi:oligopeptide/dipeptide ABC transporter ATP-binding protein
MIFQDPMTSLNPVFRIGRQIVEAIRAHHQIKGPAAAERAVNLLRLVRIASPEIRFRDFPHQFSGGMRQRVCGAIALACEPELLIADEPTSALDATIQLQYLNLLKDIQRQTRMAMIFVTHDFGVIAKMCDRVAIMYAGRIVETGGLRHIFNNPSHPYTSGLMRAVPELGNKVTRLYTIEGQPPSLHELQRGCPFAPRCPLVQDRCRVTYPPTVKIEDGHTADCWALV